MISVAANVVPKSILNICTFYQNNEVEKQKNEVQKLLGIKLELEKKSEMVQKLVVENTKNLQRTLSYEQE